MRQPSSPAVLVLALLFLADPRTAGAALLDPTRPLVGGGREEAAPPKPAEALAAAAAAADAASAPAAPPSLQSLQVPRQGEATAIVDGQLLKVGGKLGSYEVTHIDAHGLMVRGPAGRERWTLAGVEVLDSRQSAASLKMGPLGDVRKPTRRPVADAAALPPDGLPRPQGAAPSPLVFPLPAPQSQPLPLPRPAQPLEQVPPSAPVPAAPTRPAVKQALADAGTWTSAAPMTVAFEPAPMAAPVRMAPAVKRSAKAGHTWTASAPQKSLRMDLDDMRRVIQMGVQTSPVAVASLAASHWQRPLDPQRYGAWAAVWGAAPAGSQRQALSMPSTSLVLARLQAPRAQPAKAPVVRYAAVAGPRPMPASVVWRQSAPAKAWQPQGVNELPGAHTSQWASAAMRPVHIAALEAKPSTPRSFAQASAKTLPRAWGAARWAQGRSTATAVAAAPVTHSYPMAMPNWRNTPPVPADNSSVTQVAYALETP